MNQGTAIDYAHMIFVSFTFCKISKSSDSSLIRPAISAGTDSETFGMMVVSCSDRSPVFLMNQSMGLIMMVINNGYYPLIDSWE